MNVCVAKSDLSPWWICVNSGPFLKRKPYNNFSIFNEGVQNVRPSKYTRLGWYFFKIS